MKKSELYTLIDSYVKESNLFNVTVRQIIKEELNNMFTAYIHGNSGGTITENIVQNVHTKKPIIPTQSQQTYRQPPTPIDRTKIFEGDFQKVGISNPISVPGTQGLVTMDPADIDDYINDVEPSIMDIVQSGKSTGNNTMDKILNTNYSNFVKQTNKNKKV